MNDYHKINLGWVGAGFIGQVAHLNNYIELNNTKIVGLAELRPKLGEIACKKYNIPRYYKNHNELLNNQDLKAIVAIVRRQHTASVALDILNHGHHLFTEKPMAPTVEQAERLVNVAEKNNCKYVTGYMRLHDSGVQSAKIKYDNLKINGELGEVLYCRIYSFGGNDYCNIGVGYSKSDEPPPDHYIWPMAPSWLPGIYEKEYEKFNNVFIHNISLIRYFFGKTPKIKYVDHKKKSGAIILDFDEFPGIFEFAYLDTNMFWSEGIEVYFSHGMMKLLLPPAFLRNQTAKVVVYKDNKGQDYESSEIMNDWSWSFKNQAEAFISSIILNCDNLGSCISGLEDVRFIEEIWNKII